MLFSSPDHCTGQCTRSRRGIIIPHGIMLSEKRAEPWMEAEPAPLEAGAHLGQSMSANPHCYAAGTFSRSVTQVLVLLREVILFVLKGQRAGSEVRGILPHAFVWICASLW